MARADIIVSLVRSVKQGDMTSFQKAAESLIAEERAKKHNILADRLSSILNNGNKGFSNLKNVHSNQDLIFETVPQKKLDDLILVDEIHTLCHELIQEQHRVDLLRSYGLEPRHRILLAGPPGNGKTTLAECLAAELMVPFFTIRYENLIGSYLGETTNRLQKVFDYAKTRNCVLFFDEFDTIGKERGDTNETGEIKRVVSSLLLQIDRLPSYVVVITASNHPELLDRAVWRRFQICIELKSPDIPFIEKFINRFFTGKGVNFNYSAPELSRKLKVLSFAEIEEFCISVLRQAVLNHQQSDLKSIIEIKLLQLQHHFTINH